MKKLESSFAADIKTAAVENVLELLEKELEVFPAIRKMSLLKLLAIPTVETVREEI